MNKLIEISESNVQNYIDQFNAKEKNGEESLQMIFSDYKDNGDIRKVMVKTIVLNALYHTRIKDKDIPFVVQHIVNNHKEIDQLLSSGKREYKLYDIIAYIPVDGVNNAYVFASKYLSFSNTELYPIMDSFSRDLLAKYSEIYSEIPAIKGTNDYESFCDAFDAFHELVKKITKHDYKPKEIDMFIWQYAKEYFSGE